MQRFLNMLERKVLVIFFILILYFVTSFFILESYEIFSPQSVKSSYNPAAGYSSKWMIQSTDLSNTKFKSNHSYNTLNFINNTNTQPFIYNISNTQCFIPYYDFTPEEIEVYFKYKSYGDCPGKDMNTIENNILHISCHNKKPPKSYIDDGSRQLLGGSTPSMKYQSGTTRNLGVGEYAIVDCGKNEKYAFVINKFKESASLKAQQIRQNLSQNQTTKPLSVLLLILDSVSRGSAKRNFPKTMEFLHKTLYETQYNNKFSVYDFDKSGTLGLSTRPNIIPILYGQNVSYHDMYFKDSKLSSSNLYPKYANLQENALWMYYSKLGYVTMFSFESILDYLPKSTGRVIYADHVLANFWKAAKKAFGYSEFSENQRCFGVNNAHYYSLNYTAQFFANYKGHNKFAYVHTLAAHESSGNVQTIDKDLGKFLKHILKLHTNNEEDLLVYLMSDHGRGEPTLIFSQKGYFDHRVTLNYIILNQELENSLGSQHTLKHNSKQLLSRYDINLSLKSLAHHPYGGMSQDDKASIKNSYTINEVVDIFHEKIRTDRTCGDIGVSSDMCLCRDYEEIDYENNEETIIIQKIVEISEGFLLSKINDRIICEKPRINEVIYGSKFYLKHKSDGWDSNYRLIYEVQNENNVYVSVNFATKERVEALKLKKNNELPNDYFFVGETHVFIQIEDVWVRNMCGKSLCVC